MPKIKFVCRECGTEGESYPSQPRKFCSLSCRSIYGARTGTMPTKPRRGTTEPCLVCGKDVYRVKSQPAKRYCSVACQNIGMRNGVEKPCQGCGSAMYVTPSTKSEKFCTRDCYEQHRLKKSGIGRQHNGREVIRDHSGYLRIWQPDHPAANQGRILEHRWVVEQEIGRHLATDEHVHHLNGIKDDNRLENLEVMAAQDHRMLTASEMKEQRQAIVHELAEYRRRYGPLNE